MYNNIERVISNFERKTVNNNDKSLVDVKTKRK